MLAGTSNQATSVSIPVLVNLRLGDNGAGVILGGQPQSHLLFW